MSGEAGKIRKDAMVEDHQDHGKGSEEEEDEEVSLKDLLCSMQREMKTVSGKVGRLEQQLEDVKTKQEKAREEARKEAQNKKRSLKEVREANEQLKKEQSAALQKIHEEVLKEVQGKVPTTEKHAQMEQEEGDWVRRARAHLPTRNDKDRDRNVPRYSEMETRIERPKPKTTNNNGTLSLICVADWKDESIGKVKNALRAEIGQAENDSASHSGDRQRKRTWPDVNAVRHFNQYGTTSRPLMEIACTPDKAELVMDFFERQGTVVFDGNPNPCIDPTFE